MTQFVNIDRATLEQMVVAMNNAEDALNNSQALIAGRERFGFAKTCYAANEIALGFVSPAITAGRAALANAESRKQVPDMFWNHDDAETLYGSIEEFLNDEICNGTPLEVGDVRVIQRAVSMPKIQVRITAVHDEECEADYVEEPYVKATL